MINYLLSIIRIFYLNNSILKKKIQNNLNFKLFSKLLNLKKNRQN